MEIKHEQLLYMLSVAGNSYSTSKELAEMAQTSSRTILRQIKSLSDQGDALGFSVEERKGMGYRLVITQKELFDGWKNRYRHLGATSMPLALRKTALLFLTKEEVRLDELAENQNYSRSSISRIVSQVSTILSPFRLKLVSRSHKGLQLLGKELCIRTAIARLAFEGESLMEATLLLGVPAFDEDLALQTVLSISNAIGFSQDRRKAAEFLKYPLILLSRAEFGYPDPFADEIDLPDGSIAAVSAVNAIHSLVEAKAVFLPEKLSQGDIDYLALAWEDCFSLQTEIRQRYSRHAGFYHTLVENALGRVKINFGIDFLADDCLVSSLAQHVAANYGRYLLGIDEANPYSEMVQLRYPMAHYYVLELAEAIAGKTNTAISPGEIGMLTLHMASAIERKERADKIHAVVLCSTSFGTAALLKIRMERQFKNIDIIGVYSIEEAEGLSLSVDFYISTIPMKESRFKGKALLVLSPFLDTADVELLQSAILRMGEAVSMSDYFKAENFYLLERPMKKDDVLNFLCDELIKKGAIVESEKKSIFLREELVSTEIAPYVAMPHCIIGGGNFLAFALLKTNVNWGKGNVKLVMLGCFHEGDPKIKQLLMQIYRVFDNEEGVNSLLTSSNYSEFSQRLEQLVISKGR